MAEPVLSNAQKVGAGLFDRQIQRSQFRRQAGMGRGETGSSWNNAHPSRGCSQANLVATGGNGYLYCFAAN